MSDRDQTYDADVIVIGGGPAGSAASEWHDLVPANCADCGCEHYVAEDDASMVWEPGKAWDEGCTDRDCNCHLEPLIGVRR